MTERPNILLILNDDMGYSDIGCYGGEVSTPNLDKLAGNGVRLTQFYNTARCCPSRASLLTGLYPHQADIGHMTGDDGVDGYIGDLSLNTVTIAEVLKQNGYATNMSGKWHVTRHFDGPKHNWPCQRGFDNYYGIITGGADYYNPKTLTRNNKRIETPSGDYYLTDAISDEAVNQISMHMQNNSDKPFFQYVAYTAPHWPLHAHQEDVERYKGKFDQGWDKLREERLSRMVDMGIIHPNWKLTPRDSTQPEWENAEHKEWQTCRMEVYAAQIDRMDQGIGRILETLKETGQWENTLILFLSDNGGSAEERHPEDKEWISPYDGQLTTRDGKEVKFGNDPSMMPGSEETYQSYGIPWANVSNTPFREYKHWVHEGGISTPLIAHWPDGIKDTGVLRHRPAQLPDIMATVLDIVNAEYPEMHNGNEIKSCEGFSMMPLFNGEENHFTRDVLYWEHEGNCAVRKGKWKLVRKYPGDWELYDIIGDRTELNDLSDKYPEIVKELHSLYNDWAKRCSVLPLDDLLAIRKERKEN